MKRFESLLEMFSALFTDSVGNLKVRWERMQVNHNVKTLQKWSLLLIEEVPFKYNKYTTNRDKNVKQYKMNYSYM